MTVDQKHRRIYEIVVDFIDYCCEYQEDHFWDNIYESIDNSTEEEEEMAWSVLKNIKNVLTSKKVAKYVKSQQNDKGGNND